LFSGESDMSGEREARALGAGEPFEVNGRSYTLRPVGIGHLADLEREALKIYKRQYLETFAENADLLPKGQAEKLLREEMVKVARWTVDDLPKRTAYDASQVPITDSLKKWVEDSFGELPGEDRSIRALVTASLDSEQLTPERVKKMTGRPPLRGNVRFDQWWTTGDLDGMISIIYYSIKKDHPEIVREDVASWSPGKLIEAARMVESLTTASMGNG
jgi:hypothetical protein